MAEFTIVQGIDDEPTFNCQIKHILRKRDRILAGIESLRARYMKNNKIGIEFHKTAKHVLALDTKNGNNLFADAISKELENIKMELNILPNGRLLHSQSEEYS